MRIKAENTRIQALHRDADNLHVKSQSCLQLLPVASTEIVLPAYLVALPIDCRSVLFVSLFTISSSVHSTVVKGPSSAFTCLSQFIILNDLADRPLLQCLLQIRNKAVETPRPGADRFRLFQCILDKGHEF